MADNESALDRQVGGEHYTKYRIQPKVFFHANNIPHLEASIIEYVLRWRDKGGRQDLEKAKHLIDLLCELEDMAELHEADHERYLAELRKRAGDISDEP